jgi:RNA-binding protein 25
MDTIFMEEYQHPSHRLKSLSLLFQRERETKRGEERETETETQTHRERQRDTQREAERDRERDTQKETERETERGRERDRKRDRQRDRQRDRETGRQGDRETERQRERRTQKSHLNLVALMIIRLLSLTQLFLIFLETHGKTYEDSPFPYLFSLLDSSFYCGKTYIYIF